MPYSPIFNALWQLESFRTRLDEREDLLKQKEKKLLSVSSEHSENSYAVENLQSVLSTKERQITSLKQKVRWRYTVLQIVLVEIYQTRETVFHRDIRTPRRELQIRRAAEYF